jgi:hypothetical protein
MQAYHDAAEIEPVFASFLACASSASADRSFWSALAPDLLGYHSTERSYDQFDADGSQPPSDSPLADVFGIGLEL